MWQAVTAVMLSCLYESIFLVRCPFVEYADKMRIVPSRSTEDKQN